MLYKFKSAATGDLIMLEPNGRRVLEIIGKDAGPKGIILPEQMPAALAALAAVVGPEQVLADEQDGWAQNMTNALEALRTPFQYSFDISKDIDQNNTEIPTMLLQPFVENAVIHGVVPKKGKGTIQVVFSAQNQNLLVLVKDDGVGKNQQRRRRQWQRLAYSFVVPSY